MGTYLDTGYSARVEGYFVANGERIPLAKTNHVTFVLAEPRELPAALTGDLVIIVDGLADSRRVSLPEGSKPGQSIVRYVVEAPF